MAEGADQAIMNKVFSVVYENYVLYVSLAAVWKLEDICGD